MCRCYIISLTLFLIRYILNGKMCFELKEIKYRMLSGVITISHLDFKVFSIASNTLKPEFFESSVYLELYSL